jgi:UDP-N-acetylmuramoyl-L-alanyl-D-glutamate--2,6-diaminopimelate ligase
VQLVDLVVGEEEVVEKLKEHGMTEITGLTCDSRKVKPGFLFAAFPGESADGREFIPEAIGRGAAAVLAPPGTRLHPPTQPAYLLTVENPRRVFALMAARFYQFQPETIAAVTGTNGKTSVVTFLRQIWAHLGHQAASVGTLGISSPQLEIKGSLTTPDAVDLHWHLARLAKAGVDHLAMEASSHGLSQYRLDGVRIAAAAFTNLSRDHLDYHGSMEDYGAAKMRLFTELAATDGAAVINADHSWADAFILAAAGRGLRALTFGESGSELRLADAKPTARGQVLDVEVLGRRQIIELPLVGDFQASNALCALGLAIGCGADPEAAAEALEHLCGARGRLELCANHPNGAPIFVDYAHTPDALETVLKTLRPHVRGRLAVVFGCGGDRDNGKRPQMGRIAGELADLVIVTDDNPRTEDADKIRRHILIACAGAVEIGDRGEAIRTAVSQLQPDDLLLVAGKGHESGQIVGAEVLPFDDAETVRAAVAEVAE